MVTKRIVCFAVAAVAGATTFNAVADGSGTGPNSWIGYVFGGNLATAPSSAVAAGTNNLASGQGAFVGAGTANQANGLSSLVIGGFDNRANNIDALVGAGAGNRATGLRAIVVGGGYNIASGNFSFIGGGGRDGTGSTPAGNDPNLDNQAFGKWSFIGAGHGNVAGQSGAADAARSSAVVAGSRNTASGRQAFIGSGGCNVASGDNSVVVGGGSTSDSGVCQFGNMALGGGSFVGAGIGNTASGTHNVISGGLLNNATGSSSTVAGGFSNRATGNYSVVPGGEENTASGHHSFAAGFHANADQPQCFVFANWSDFSGLPPSCLGSTNVARFLLNHGLSVEYFSARLDGGGNRWVHIGDLAVGQTIATWTGAFLSDTGVWNNNSDRASKSDFTSVDVRDVLARVVEMPISTWRYNGDTANVRHIGPMAQDFRAAFGLGADDKHIGTIDADGVALAAIQGLHQLVQEMQRTIQAKDAQIAALAAKAESQQQEMVELRRAVEVLLARSSLDAQIAQR